MRYGCSSLLEYRTNKQIALIYGSRYGWCYTIYDYERFYHRRNISEPLPSKEATISFVEETLINEGWTILTDKLMSLI